MLANIARSKACFSSCTLLPLAVYMVYIKLIIIIIIMIIIIKIIVIIRKT